MRHSRIKMATIKKESKPFNLFDHVTVEQRWANKTSVYTFAQRYNYTFLGVRGMSIPKIAPLCVLGMTDPPRYEWKRFMFIIEKIIERERKMSDEEDDGDDGFTCFVNVSIKFQRSPEDKGHEIETLQFFGDQEKVECDAMWNRNSAMVIGIDHKFFSIRSLLYELMMKLNHKTKSDLFYSTRKDEYPMIQRDVDDKFDCFGEANNVLSLILPIPIAKLIKEYHYIEQPFFEDILKIEHSIEKKGCWSVLKVNADRILRFEGGIDPSEGVKIDSGVERKYICQLRSESSSYYSIKTHNYYTTDNLRFNNVGRVSLSTNSRDLVFIEENTARLTFRR